MDFFENFFKRLYAVWAFVSDVLKKSLSGKCRVIAEMVNW